MKKVKLFTLVLVASSAIVITACKKKSTDAATPAPTPAANVICDGNGSGSYYPLVANNTWSYKDSYSNSFNNTVGTTTTYGSFTYFTVNNSLGGTIYLRTATNGDIMAYSNSNSDILYIPHAPTNNQTWACNQGLAATRKVVTTNAS